MSNSTLKEKTAKGLGWGFIESFSGTGLTAIISIILANILAPEQFGLVGMVAIFVTLGNSLMDSGFSGALIRKSDVTDKDLSTVFYTNLALGAGIYAILYAISPWVASFLGYEILTKLLRVLSLSVIIVSFTQVQKVNFIRKIDFKTQAIISLIAAVTSGVASIWMALTGWGVWALVAQQLSKQAMISKLLASSLISTVWNEIYSFVIGKMYNPVQVGYFVRADKFKSLVTQNIGQVVQKVGYPVMSTIQDDPTRQVRVYSRIVRLTMLITCTLVMGLLGCAESMIHVLIGEQWLPSVPYLRLLGLSGLFLPLILASVNVFNANGKSEVTLKLEVIKTLLAAIPVTLGIIYDINMMLWGMVAVSALSYLVHAWYVSKEIPYSLVRQVADIIPFFACSAVMGGVVYVIGNAIELSPLLTLLVQLAAGFVITVISYEFIYRAEEYRDIRNQALKVLKLKK